MTEEQRDPVLSLLQEDLDANKKLLETIKEQVQENDISNYPIFVASEDIIELGKLVINKTEMGGNWNFYASHLEEFAIKELVLEDKVPNFIKVYKEHADELCIFVVKGLSGDFIFLPA